MPPPYSILGEREDEKQVTNFIWPKMLRAICRGYSIWLILTRQLSFTFSPKQAIQKGSLFHQGARSSTVM